MIGKCQKLDILIFVFTFEMRANSRYLNRKKDIFLVYSFFNHDVVKAYIDEKRACEYIKEDDDCIIIKHSCNINTANNILIFFGVKYAKPTIKFVRNFKSDMEALAQASIEVIRDNECTIKQSVLSIDQ